MDSLDHTRDQGPVETVDFTRQTCFKEVQDYPIRRNRGGHSFLRLQKDDLHRLHLKGKMVTGPSNAKYFGRLDAELQKSNHTRQIQNMSYAMAPYQLLPPTSKRLIGRITVQTAVQSTIFVKFGLSDFSAAKLERFTRWAKFESDEEIIIAKGTYFADWEKMYFADELKKMEHHCVKCI